MNNMDKLKLLDQCIDGQVDKFNELLDTAFDQFNEFYSICKQNIEHIKLSNIKYGGIIDRKAMFNISCDNVDDKINRLVVNTGDFDGTITVEKAHRHIAVNITLKGE